MTSRRELREKHGESWGEHRSCWLAWEVLAIVASLVCQGAIVVVLMIMNNRPLREWTAAISINTIIATLTTVAKMSMLVAVGSCIRQLKWIYFKTGPRHLHHFGIFDDAAGGPLGAAQMVQKVRWSVAWFAAFIMLLAFANSPFAQQVISFQERVITRRDASASFGISRNYTTQSQRNQFGGNIYTNAETVDESMHGAILNGLFGLESPALYNCGANCTWTDPFISLGFDNTCKNVTQLTLANKTCGAVFATDVTGKPDSREMCNMTTPGGITISTSYLATVWQTVLIFGAKNLFIEMSDPFEPDYSARVFSPNFLRVAVWRAPSVYNGNSEGGFAEIVGEELVECDIRLSAWRYEGISARGANFTIGSRVAIPLENGTWWKSGDTPASMATDISFKQENLPEFIIKATDLGAINDFFCNEPFAGLTATGIPPTTAVGMGVGVRSPLYKLSISDIFSNVTLSMTDYLRSRAGSERAVGSTVENVTFVTVQWLWLTLPLALELATIVLLIITLVQNKKVHGAVLWESSNLSLLFMKYDESQGLVHSNTTNVSNMNDVSKLGKARLT